MLQSKIECENCGAKNYKPSNEKRHRSILKCPNCKSEFVYQKNVYFNTENKYPTFNADDFIHPLDRAGINALRKIPGLNKATKKMMQYSYEKYVRVNQLGDNIRVTSRTCSYIHDMICEASKKLGISPPSTYLDQNPIANAYTTCVEKPIIVIQSGLIELCDDDELFAVIAHETGHIKCEHVLYHMLADFLTMFPSFFPIGDLLAAPLKIALLDWCRKSELSADRLAYIVTENKEKFVSLLLKLAGGSTKLMDMIDHSDFEAQYSEWESMMEKFGNKIFKFAGTIFRSHPFPIVRACELNSWIGNLENGKIAA